jgi:hypothetical protein
MAFRTINYARRKLRTVDCHLFCVSLPLQCILSPALCDMNETNKWSLRNEKGFKFDRVGSHAGQWNVTSLFQIRTRLSNRPQPPCNECRAQLSAV